MDKSETEAKVVGWVGTYPYNPELKLWPLKPGIYWVMIAGDSESVDGLVLWEYGDYLSQMEISGFYEDTGKPIAVGQFDEDWDNVIAYYQTPVVQPEKYQ